MTSLRFDQVIPTAYSLLSNYFAGNTCETTLVRDSFGTLSVVLPDDALTNASAWNELACQLHQALGVYSPGEGQVLLRRSDLIDPSDIIESPDRVRLPDAPNTWLVDRLQTNQDWLREPLVDTYCRRFQYQGWCGSHYGFCVMGLVSCPCGKECCAR